MTIDYSDEWASATQVAHVFGVSRQTANHWIVGGKFKTARALPAGKRPIYIVSLREVRAVVATEGRRRTGEANGLKRECAWGHPLDAHNTGINSAGARYCRTCHRAAQKRSRRKVNS